MARYFFHVVDEDRQDDEEGMELPDTNAARIAGIAYAGSVIHNEPRLVDRGAPLCIEVADGEGQVLFTVLTRLIVGPAPRD